jgi:conjugal transfer mating pair stabilization protein TraG
MTDVNSDIGLLAGYLIASVPFLAGGVAKGAMAISAPRHELSQPEPECGRGSGARGKHGQCLAGQQQLREFERPDPPVRARHDRAELHLWRGADPNGFSDTGSMTTSFPKPATIRSRTPAIPSRRRSGQEFTSAPLDHGIAGPLEQRELCEHRHGIDDQRRHEVPRTAQPVQPRHRPSRARPAPSNSDSIQTAFNEVDQASTNLQRQFGLSRRRRRRHFDRLVPWWRSGR